MTLTPTLFDALPAFEAPAETAGMTLQDKFEAFHAANPWVYAALCQLARTYRERRGNRIGIKMLFEVLRWQWSMATTSEEPWRLNNSLTSRYARLIMDNEPDLSDAFELRELKCQ